VKPKCYDSKATHLVLLYTEEKGYMNLRPIFQTLKPRCYGTTSDNFCSFIDRLFISIVLAANMYVHLTPSPIHLYFTLHSLTPSPIHLYFTLYSLHLESKIENGLSNHPLNNSLFSIYREVNSCSGELTLYFTFFIIWLFLFLLFCS